MLMRRLAFVLTLALSVCACTEKETAVSDSVPESVQFKVHSLTMVEEDASTRVALVHDGNVQRFRWEATDTVGVFPNAGSQVWFSMSSGVGTNTATFDGGAWSLRESSTYYSYYPFVGDMYLASDRVPVCFSGQRQSGMAFSNGVMYMGATGTTNAQGGLVFDYDHLNAVLWFDLTLPAGTYTKATLSASEPVLVKEGHFDLSNPSIVADRYTKSLDVTLENFTVQGGSSVPVYLSIAPADLTTKTLKLEVLGADGRRLTCQWVPSVAYEASHCYHLARMMTAPTPSVWMDTNVWHENNGIPDFTSFPDYDSNQSTPYLHWYAKPATPSGPVALLLAGEDYNSAPEEGLLDQWAAALTARGIQCVALMYRTPRSRTREYYRSAWQDAQRAVRIIRNACWLAHDTFPFDKDKIGVVGFSAGAQVGLLLATRSQELAYPALDAYETNISAHLNWAILQGTAYATADSDGALSTHGGSVTESLLNPAFPFHANTPPICFLHGQDDPYTPIGATLAYRQLRIRGIPSEVHLYPGVGHEPVGLDRGLDFLTQIGMFGALQTEQDVTVRYSSDSARRQKIREDVWPSGQIPCPTVNQSTPYIEWHFPVNKKTDAIQIIYSGGAYEGSSPDNLEVAPLRRYLNAKGVTVVTLCYRYKLPTGRLTGLPKHLGPWQDLQRAIRKVRSEAAGYGLDPNRIGIMGFSAGGHLTLMGATSSRYASYTPIDVIDQLSCSPQWAVAFYPAYSLTDDDGLYGGNANGGNLDTDVLVSEFAFDENTPSMLFLHGDADNFASMASVKAWEQLNRMGIPAEVHTYATRGHCLQWKSSPGTGSYNCFDRVWEYMQPWMY